MFPRFQIMLVSSMLLLMVFILLSWNTMDRLNRFSANQQVLESALLKGAGNQLLQRIQDLQTRVLLFSEEHHPQIAKLVQYPDNAALRVAMQQRVKRHFPDYSNFMLADANGFVKFTEQAPPISEHCQNDLLRFSQMSRQHGADHLYPLYTHPHQSQHHINIMSPFLNQRGLKQEGIFLVSFKAHILAQILADYELPGYQLMLLKQDDPGLIEITAKGGRETLQRAHQLDRAEQRSIHQHLQIPGSLWKLVVLSSPALYQNYQQSALLEAALVLGLVLFVTFLIVRIAWLSYRC
ncbi:hypothetical protein [Candidatus Venteria ishoeyi]|uniref:Double Cache domain-containing protein n=1 Tax=Candidatus Venteria ishoeyi TaxID=1899563 RepID=A0A1H6FFT3_9GAMM|nr:hypothetical protein [Candidatus Venteria ishoeyi]SEH08922.1 Uncharacterised protein [Candidatus Venteria ishoeyi]